jgi:hypothetical protein
LVQEQSGQKKIFACPFGGRRCFSAMGFPQKEIDLLVISSMSVPDAAENALTSGTRIKEW